MGWPTIISANLGSDFLDARYLWRWAVTAAAQYLHLDQGTLETVMQGPEGSRSRNSRVIVDGKSRPARRITIGLDATVTLPDSTDLAFAILDRDSHEPYRVVDGTGTWWPKVVDRQSTSGEAGPA
ncbi:MAG: hypothetical protein HZY73_12735 [Micropruina sp.]|nr:MAG: hypothetical protein HZY73_12735 [Micropruina sp.]